MNIITLTPPPFEPVTLAEAYAHLRWDADEEGSPPEPVYPLADLVTRNLVTAREHVEKVTRRAFVEQTLLMALPGFPAMRTGFGSGWAEDCLSRPGAVELKRPPFLELVSVQYLDAAETLQTLDASHYYVDELQVVPVLRFRDSFDVGIAARRSDAVRITWRAGYAPEGSPPQEQVDYAANVPTWVKDAILLKLQLLVDRFDKGEREDLEGSLAALLAPNTVHSF